MKMLYDCGRRHTVVGVYVATITGMCAQVGDRTCVSVVHSVHGAHETTACAQAAGAWTWVGQVWARLFVYFKWRPTDMSTSISSFLQPLSPHC